jgi:UDP-N-acetylglucosamine acyltransferase
LREYVTVNRGTLASGITEVGANCLLMAYTHVGHDSVVGDNVVLANAVHLGGHVTVGEGAVISGITGVNQFVAIGAGSFIGGGLRAIKDVLPFTKGLGDPMRYGGLNPKGLQRMGFPTASEGWLKSAYRILAGEGKAACRAWLASEGDQARGAGDASKERLAALVDAYLARQARSLLTRTPGIDVSET